MDADMMAAMPKGYPQVTCKGCERPVDICGSLSVNRKLCRDCGDARAIANFVCMTTKSGPYWHWWRQRVAASVGGVLVDNRQRTE